MGAECSRCGNDIYDECGYCNLRDERDALLAERDGLLRQREFDEQRYEAMCIERYGLSGDLAVALAERDALREAGEKLAECVRPNALTRERLAAWRAATGEGV